MEVMVVAAFYSRLDVRVDAQQLAERHAQPLVQVMVDAAARLHPRRVPLQQVQDQRPQVPGDQQRVVLLQEQLGQTSQDALPVLLAPYLWMWTWTDPWGQLRKGGGAS